MTATPSGRCTDCNWIVPDHREDCPKFAAHQAYLAGKPKETMANAPQIRRSADPSMEFCAVCDMGGDEGKNPHNPLSKDCRVSEAEAVKVVSMGDPTFSADQRKLTEETIDRNPLLQKILAERVDAAVFAALAYERQNTPTTVTPDMCAVPVGDPKDDLDLGQIAERVAKALERIADLAESGVSLRVNIRGRL